MSLIILEGLDRTGKSSVAKFYENQGYEVIHMSAPAKGTSASAYLDQMIELLTSISGKNVVLDRSHYGELVWPLVYGRTPLLVDEDFEVLRELEDAAGVERILMHDPNIEAHWKRCVDNNEPLTKAQFVKARALFSTLADQYGFKRKTLSDFPEIQSIELQTKQSNSSNEPDRSEPEKGVFNGSSASGTRKVTARTPQQLKLDKANAINDILSRRIIKSKGPVYDELESSVRTFLNTELGKIFGSNASSNVASFTQEEVELLKFFCERLKDKEK